MKQFLKSRKNLVIGAALLLVMMVGFAVGSSQFRRSSQTQHKTSELTQAPDPQAAAAVRTGDNVIGDADAAELILISYSDMNCKFCGQFYFTMAEIADEYGDKIAWVYRHFTLQESAKEAMAAECAGHIGGAKKFWEYLDAYYQNPISPRSEKYDQLLAMGEDNGVDIAECMSSQQTSAKVQADLKNAGEMGLQGTPSTVIIFPATGEREILAGAYSTEDMRDILDSYLE